MTTRPAVRWRRLMLIGLLALLAVLAGCTPGPRSRPVRTTENWEPPTSLPRAKALASDRLTFDSDRTGNFELYAMPHDGGSKADQLTDDPGYDSWSPRLSPDRRTLVFLRSPRGEHDRDYSKVSIWAAGADGSDPTQLRPVGLDDWGLQGHPEWSPDGKRLVMFGGRQGNPQLFLTDALGQGARALTDRPGQNLDPAFARDGRTVVFTGCPQALCLPRGYEIYSIPVDGGTADRLTDDDLRDHDPMWDRKGRELAWLTGYGGVGLGEWDIRVRGTDGTLRRLVDDPGVTSRPEYSRDNRWIFMHRIAPQGRRFDVWRVRPDGSGLTNLTAGQPGNNEYPDP